MTAPRGMAARVARLRSSLGDRERAVLGSLQELRLLTTKHIQRLHVAAGSKATRGRRTRAVLRRLIDLGLVVRLDREVGGRGAGSQVAAFCLSGLGQTVVAAGHVEPRPRRTIWRTKPYFQEHMLAVADLYVDLVETCQGGRSELLSFQGEPRAWRRFSGAHGAPVNLRPDAYIRVAVGDCELASFVEIDMGTESLPTIQRKCRTFLSYWRAGLEQQQTGVFPQVVWLVPDDRRQSGIANMLQRLTDADSNRLFTVALQQHGPAILTTLPDDTGGWS